MAHLILTETDINTITNALSGLASACRADAEQAPDNAAGRFLRDAVTASADQYEALALKIAVADSIAFQSSEP